MKKKVPAVSFLILVLMFIVFLALPANSSAIQLDMMMSEKEQDETGVCNLTLEQKQALEKWITEHFVTKPRYDEKELSLAMNIGQGKVLQLSDGSFFQIAPHDQIYTTWWITPVSLKITTSGSTDYPFLLTNLNNKTSVQAKEVTWDELEPSAKQEIQQQPASPSSP